MTEKELFEKNQKLSTGFDLYLLGHPEEERPEGIIMTYKGVVKGNVIELEGDVALPEGTRVSVIPEQPATVAVPPQPMTLKEWLREARQVRAQLPKTRDSVEILRKLRERRASR